MFCVEGGEDVVAGVGVLVVAAQQFTNDRCEGDAAFCETDFDGLVDVGVEVDGDSNEPLRPRRPCDRPVDRSLRNECRGGGCLACGKLGDCRPHLRDGGWGRVGLAASPDGQCP